MDPGDPRRARGRPISSGESVAAPGAGRPRLAVVVTDEHGRVVPAGGLARWLVQVAPSRARGTIGVALVSDRCVRALNRAYLGHDRPTDVLSFPALELPGRPFTTKRNAGRRPLREREVGTGRANDGHLRRRAAGSSGHLGPDSARAGRYLGDIVIARGVARRQARANGHDEPMELRVLALHGLLHLLGYDHERDGGTMARVEHRLRRRGGLTAGLLDRVAGPRAATQ